VVENKVVLTVGRRSDVDVGPRMVDVHNVVYDLGCLLVQARLRICI
jgi:hypothetical protein